jgi:hypothetical protein
VPAALIAEAASTAICHSIAKAIRGWKPLPRTLTALRHQPWKFENDTKTKKKYSPPQRGLFKSKSNFQYHYLYPWP